MVALTICPLGETVLDLSPLGRVRQHAPVLVRLHEIGVADVLRPVGPRHRVVDCGGGHFELWFLGDGDDRVFCSRYAKCMCVQTDRSTNKERR